MPSPEAAEAGCSAHHFLPKSTKSSISLHPIPSPSSRMSSRAPARDPTIEQLGRLSDASRELSRSWTDGGHSSRRRTTSEASPPRSHGRPSRPSPLSVGRLPEAAARHAPLLSPRTLGCGRRMVAHHPAWTELQLSVASRQKLEGQKQENLGVRKVGIPPPPGLADASAANVQPGV